MRFIVINSQHDIRAEGSRGDGEGKGGPKRAWLGRRTGEMADRRSQGDAYIPREKEMGNVALRAD
jgi:hypothetical protein